MKNYVLIIIVSLWISSCNNYKVEYDENAITVASFNLEWFGDGIKDRNERSDYDCRRIAELIVDTGADIIGLQEIENKQAMERLMKFLPGYKYMLGETGYIQNPAILYRDTVKVEFVENYQPMVVKKDRTRAGLVVKAKKGNFDFLIMVVHFKSTSRYDSTEQMKIESYELRKLQAKVIRNWADSVYSNTNEKDIIIVGDFNDNPKRESKVLSPITFGGEYLFLTDNLGSCKNPNWDNIDHIVINRSTFKRFVQGSVMMYNSHAKYEDYEVEKISDHCPVLSKFNIILPDND